MTLRETTALVLLFRACPDEALKRKVLGLLPELGELVETATDTVKSQHRVLRIADATVR